MGEYAIRISDHQEVKIGTCESMYYLRYEDRHLVSKLENSLDAGTCLDLFWRLPFPDEDHIRIGEYREYNRGLRLYKPGEGYAEDFEDPDTISYPGTIQLHHQASGLLLSVACYHVLKLPEKTKEYSPGWNGKGYSFELIHVKNTGDGVFPIVRCRHCYRMWRYTWPEILPYVQDEELKRRLEVHAK